MFIFAEMRMLNVQIPALVINVHFLYENFWERHKSTCSFSRYSLNTGENWPDYVEMRRININAPLFGVELATPGHKTLPARETIAVLTGVVR